jgi:glycine/D-amino acid oxidase-like deaminating enzyme
MYRQMYSDPYYATMQAQALDMWRQLEQDSGVTLLKEQGLLFYGDTDTGGREGDQPESQPAAVPPFAEDNVLLTADSTCVG